MNFKILLLIWWGSLHALSYEKVSIASARTVANGATGVYCTANSQILNWNDRKIDIICCKSNNKKDSLIYNNINILKIYTFQYHGIEYKINNQNLDIFDPINNNTFSFKFLNKKINWKEILNGQNTVFSIMKNFNDSEKKNFLDKINFMIDNSILDISFHPIASYKKYYSNKTN